MSDLSDAKTLSIEKINALIRGIVETETLGFFYWTNGKVERYHKSDFGHIYFTLVDEQKSIRCMIPESQQGNIDFTIQNDIEIRVLGDIQVYENNAQVQIQVINAELIDSNDIDVTSAISQLKQEGLYPKTPKPTPESINKIALITSRNSRAIGDFETTYQIKGKSNVLAPYEWKFTLLEGDRAVESIVDSIEELNRRPDIDIIAIIRGGGRNQNLAVFDDLNIARAIAKSNKYVITGIGHDRDSTLSDQVSDYAASTPTAVAIYLEKLVLESRIIEPISPSNSKNMTTILMGLIGIMFVIILVLLLLNFQ